MKTTTIILTLMVLSFVTLNLACGDKSNKNQYPSPTPTVATPPSPEISPSPKSGSGNLVEATGSGDIGFELAGIEGGDSRKMNLTVRNNSERVWELKIEVGTKLEPTDGNIQQMVVTKEVEAHLEPHDEKSITLEVSCLDISKLAPSSTSTKWHLVSSKNLAEFISCVNKAIDDLKVAGEVSEKNRPDVIQLALWTARGATHDEWVGYYQHYQNMSVEEAEQEIAKNEPIARKIIDRCPAL